MSPQWRCVCLLLFVLSASLVSWLYLLPSDTPPTLQGSRSAHTLKLVFVVSRHGNRGPLFSFPKDPYPPNNTEHWKYGRGELTTQGRVQMYKLGEKIRSLYNGFLKPNYYREDFSASSTAIDRTIISAQAFLAGLFPPVGFQVWHEKILWQPIPVYPDSPDKTQLSSGCAKIRYERAKSKTQFEKQYASNLTEVNRYTVSDIPGHWHDLFTLWDCLLAEETEGFTLPEWTKEIYPDAIADLVQKYHVAFWGATDTVTRLVIGPFLDNMIDIVRKKVNGTLTPDRSMFFFSGHDATLLNLKVAMGVPRTSMQFVKPSSALIYEVHQDPGSGGVSIQVLYIDGSSADLGPTPITMPHCGQPCDFESFLNITEIFRGVEFDKECELEHPPG